MAMMTEGCNGVAATSIEGSIEEWNGRRHLKVDPAGADATVWV
ncbi:MAG: hypothetical protein WCA57_03605 [Ilumatobacteraceae bacterium]